MKWFRTAIFFNFIETGVTRFELPFFLSVFTETKCRLWYLFCLLTRAKWSNPLFMRYSKVKLNTFIILSFFLSSLKPSSVSDMALVFIPRNENGIAHYLWGSGKSSWEVTKERQALFLLVVVVVFIFVSFLHFNVFSLFSTPFLLTFFKFLLSQDCQDRLTIFEHVFFLFFSYKVYLTIDVFVIKSPARQSEKLVRLTLPNNYAFPRFVCSLRHLMEVDFGRWGNYQYAFLKCHTHNNGKGNYMSVWRTLLSSWQCLSSFMAIVHSFAMVVFVYLAIAFLA